MPTYEYKCQACGNRFDRFQPITAKAIKKCPKCGKNKVQRLISAGGGMIFKGSGFYITDYRDSAYKDKAKADSDAAKPAETKTETTAASSTDSSSKSTEAKPAAPAAKSESKPAKAAKSEKKKQGDSSRSER